MRDRTVLFAPLALLIGLAAVFGLYLPGMTASIMFDTGVNLSPLERMTGGDVWIFVFGGEAGPLGRPIALATFVLQADQWPQNPAALRVVNVVIHIVNGLLVAWMAFLLGRSQGLKASGAAWAAVLAALIWAASPLLASTNLFIIQRMTSLAVLFMLMGVVSHLHLRALVASRPMLGYVLLSLSLCFFTLAATLSKENGILLPVLILVMEVFLLTNPDRAARYRWMVWRGIFLALPLALVVFYLWPRWNYGPGTVAMRGFESHERLMTQTVILWEYLFHAVLPAMHRIGPFHDGYPVYRSMLELPVLLSIVGWLVAIAASILLRRKFPLLGFAVFWYLAAHLLESTVVPLELYFEHRNYAALVGPVIAVAIVLFRLPQPPRNLLLTGVVLYLALCLFVLFRTAVLWGSPPTAAQFWFDHNPGSPRAIQYQSQQLIARGDTLGAMATLEMLERIEGESGFFLLRDMAFRCAVGVDNQYENPLEEFERRLDETRLTFTILGFLSTMQEIRREAECDNYSEDDLMEMARMMLSNERFSANTYAVHSLSGFLGTVYFNRQEYASAIDHLYESLQLRIGPQQLFLLAVSYLETGQYVTGCQHLDTLRLEPFQIRRPWRFHIHHMWNRHVEIYMGDMAEAAGVESCEELIRSIEPGERY